MPSEQGLPRLLHVCRLHNGEKDISAVTGTWNLKNFGFEYIGNGMIWETLKQKSENINIRGWGRGVYMADHGNLFYGVIWKRRVRSIICLLPHQKAKLSLVKVSTYLKFRCTRFFIVITRKLPLLQTLEFRLDPLQHF